MTELNGPFDFQACISILKATGKKAPSLTALRELVGGVSETCIFHHTYQYFLKGHILEYTNDFAQWAGESLEERVLAEHLSNIDPYSFGSIKQLRQALIDVIDNYLAHYPEPREAMQGDEFYFNETVTLVFPVGVRAKNLAEFLAAIKYVDPASIYYHFFESRIRLGSGDDDFSRWMKESLGKEDLAKEIRSMDPFMLSLEEIRGHIAAAVDEVVRKDMEVIPE
jgi:hypothetical protein